MAFKAPFKPEQSQGGVALFLVIAAVSVLAILVTEFTYITHINQRISSDSLDQVKATYLAKSAYKLSLLRLVAFDKARELIKQQGLNISKSLLDNIWSFPLRYPIDSEFPGFSASDKDKIKKFHDSSSMDGQYQSVIESESTKYNLNLVLPNFAPPKPKDSKKNTPQDPPTDPNQPNKSDPPQADSKQTFDPETARLSLREFLTDIFKRKLETDETFNSDYRDFRLDDLIDQIIAWADLTYDLPLHSSDNPIPTKKAPFYSITELHMIYLMDDRLYDLFSKSLTVNPSLGININKVKQQTIQALIPEMKTDETKQFIEDRDSKTKDGTFNSIDQFYTYLKNNVGAFQGTDTALNEFKDRISKRNIALQVDDSEFHIRAIGTFNHASKTIEAFVRVGKPAEKKDSKSPSRPENIQQIQVSYFRII